MPLRQTQYGGVCPLERFEIDGAAPGSYTRDPVEACIPCNFADIRQKDFVLEKICQCLSNMTLSRYDQLRREYVSTAAEPTRPGFWRFARERAGD
jgi:hypothetical protein